MSNGAYRKPQRRQTASRLAPSLILSASSLVFAADPVALKPGRYVTEGGVLTIEQASGGETKFELVSVSPWNGHTCGPMEGEIRNRIWSGPVGSAVTERSCTVKFLPNGDGIEVTSNGDACRDECGAAVTFDGIYVKLPSECDSPALTKTEQQFKSAYDSKDYAKARSILEPALVHCASILERSEVDSMRNDLAITQYHLHDLAGCRRTLEPLREDAAKTDPELKSQFPVFALDARLPGIRAARTNLKLCGDSQRSAASTDVPEPLRSALQQIKHKTSVPVLLPTRLPAGSGRGYASATGDASGWNIRIESRPDCLGANSCFTGYLSGKLSASSSTAENTVVLVNGVNGYYVGRSCGGSCSPPEIRWSYLGVTYAIQYEVDGSEKEVADQLIALANSAILGGAR